MSPSSQEKPFAPLIRIIQKEEIVPLLQKSEKPGRYAGGEFGIPQKDLERVQVRFLFSYPDVYEIGMSNQGIKILYDRINQRDEFLADRVFTPWVDFAEELKKAKLPLWGLDRRLSCSSYDAWGFNLSHELTFTNFLFLLELGQVPLLRKERTANDPIILAGGTAITNPLPVFDFLDGIFIGDGEEAIVEIAELIASGKKKGLDRSEIIQNLSNVKGMVLPHLYSPDATNPGSVTGPIVSKRNYHTQIFADLSSIPQASIQITQDRVVLEVARGCGQGCRFCHAGFWKRPVRNSDVECLVEAAERMLRETGLDSLSLHSLSLADYPRLENLVHELSTRMGPRGISLSLPSLRVDGRTLPVLEATSGVRKSSVTIALEAGSEYMRARIRKRSSEERLREMVGEIFDKGWDLVKVYFMLGLPDEEGRETEDVTASLNALGFIAKQSGQRKNINATVSLFVPKPHTTFQWEELKSPDYFREAMHSLRDGLKSRRVRIKSPSPWMAYVEGVISRADIRMGEILLKAYRSGAVFDSWDDQFRRDLWMELFAETPAEWMQSWTEKKTPGDPLPWDLFSGEGERGLLRDHERFSQITPDSFEPKAPFENRKKPEDSPELQPAEMPPEMFHTEAFLEIRYAKEWPMVYVSHLDTAEAIRRACRRTGLPMTFSQGFNKHEKFHYGESLPLFFASEGERLYVDIRERIDAETFLKDVATKLPDGLRIVQARVLEKAPGADKGPVVYRLDFSAPNRCEACLDLLRNAPEAMTFEKRDKKKKRKFGPPVMKSVTKIVRSAISLEEQSETSLSIKIEHPDTGAVSITDLITGYFKIPATLWNTELTITRRFSTD